MKISMHNWMRPEPIETTLQRLHRFGYDGIEISGEPERHDTAEIRRSLDKYKLECWGGVTMMFPGRDLVHEDPAVRASTVAYMKDCLRMIHELDGKMFCIVPSVVGKTKPMASPADEWRWVVEGLKQVTDFAAKYRIVCGVEPLNRFETYLINRHDQALRLADDVGNDLRVVLDAFHINIEERDPMQAIRNVGSRLLDFHVADNNRRPAGQGTYDWKLVLQTLAAAGYQGHLTAEFVLTVDRTPLAVMGDRREADMQFTEADLKFIQVHGAGLTPAADYDRATRDNITHLKECLASAVGAAR